MTSKSINLVHVCSALCNLILAFTEWSDPRHHIPPSPSTTTTHVTPSNCNMTPSCPVPLWSWDRDEIGHVIARRLPQLPNHRDQVSYYVMHRPSTYATPEKPELIPWGYSGPIYKKNPVGLQNALTRRAPWLDLTRLVPDPMQHTPPPKVPLMIPRTPQWYPVPLIYGRSLNSKHLFDYLQTFIAKKTYLINPAKIHSLYLYLID